MGAPSKWLIPANPKAPRLLYSVPLTSGRPLLTHTSPLLETPGLSWASLGQPLVGSLLLFPGSWCAQGFVCALQVSVSPVLCKSCNQIPLVFKVKFPRGSQCLCQIPPGWGIFVGPRTFATVWELLWYNCSPVWGSSAWWLYSGANGELLQEDLCHTPCSHVCQSPCPCPHGRPLLTCAPTGTLGHSKAGLIQFFVGSLGSGAPRVLFEPSKHLWWVWGLILNAISLLQLSCWGFSLALGW